MVIGMGFIGSEVAASLRQLGVSVTAVMSGASPLETVLGREVGAVMASIHTDESVDLVPGDRAIGCEGSTVVTRVVTARGQRLDCDFVVIGAGIGPNVGLLVNTPVALDNGELVVCGALGPEPAGAGAGVAAGGGVGDGAGADADGEGDVGAAATVIEPCISAYPWIVQ